MPYFVSTHSRPKAAVKLTDERTKKGRVSTHSRPKAADLNATTSPVQKAVSTHSRPKAADMMVRLELSIKLVSTHSRPKAAVKNGLPFNPYKEFQHTAARRRLQINADTFVIIAVSTHSRPKAAGCEQCGKLRQGRVSTHSRPKAAGSTRKLFPYSRLFQHTAARRRLAHKIDPFRQEQGFQHTAARRRLSIRYPFYFLLIVSTHSRPKAAGIFGLMF